MKQFLVNIFYNLTLHVFKYLSYVIVKKKRFFAIYPLHDSRKFSGNTRAIALYIKDNVEGVDFVVVSNNKNVHKECKELDIKVKKTLLGFSWHLLRAEFVFTDASSSPLLKYGKLDIVQLWHGVGFKNIALLNDSLNEESKNNLKEVYKKYVLLITSSEHDFKKKQESFLSPHIVITGSPRNDIFFSSTKDFDKLKVKYGLEAYSKIITYAPTFRDFETKAPFSATFWEELQLFLEEQNQIFVIKKHPWDKYLIIPNGFKNIKDFSTIIADPQELLLITDLLISDYSSISTDFALTNRPILIYAYDFKAYKENCRSIYYNLEEILPQPFVYNEKELLGKLKDSSWIEKENYQQSYHHFRNVFHKFVDGNSSKRVLEEVFKLKK